MSTKTYTKEAADALRALWLLMQYTGGWDAPSSHPAGHAARVLKRHPACGHCGGPKLTKAGRCPVCMKRGT